MAHLIAGYLETNKTSWERPNSKQHNRSMISTSKIGTIIEHKKTTGFRSSVMLNLPKLQLVSTETTSPLRDASHTRNPTSGLVANEWTLRPINTTTHQQNHISTINNCRNFIKEKQVSTYQQNQLSNPKSTQEFNNWIRNLTTITKSMNFETYEYTF